MTVDKDLAKNQAPVIKMQFNDTCHSNHSSHI